MLSLKSASALPENGIDFQRHRHTAAVRDDARRIVRRETGRRDGCTINPRSRLAGQRLDARHLPSDRVAAIDSIGIQLDLHSLRVEVVEIHLYLKDMLSRICLYRHVAKA